MARHGIERFWDLGGQTSIRNIWNRYYSQCHAVAYVVDAQDREHLDEGWEVFHSVLSDPEILDVPLLLLANKQDNPESLSAEEIRDSYETWWQARLKDLPTDNITQSQDRVASLQVIGISALNGQGIHEAIDWLFLRVQNSRRRERD
ncbi:hypothetical protein Clacol_000715 [Clathrus columnatus]|uniref:Uncharacterized protein n=1 Tax=Clathrus columnatus TaxID=1419009 RepID=A0AAV5A1L8_9AGAM|nr:hypothetical protein Clacol_000715 [Clathrus columnatus]